MLNFVIVVKTKVFLYNKIKYNYVLIYVMETIDRNKKDFESKPFFRANVYFSDEKRSFKRFENQHFVVPWQLEKTREIGRAHV